ISRDSPKADMLQIFHYLEQHISFYYILLTNKGTPTFRDQLLHVVQEMISVHLNRQNILLRVNKDFLVQFVASATVGIVEWWIINEMPYPAASMVDQLWQLFEKVELVNSY
ncbi:MAG: TetR family transcriptional regulator, partial [Sporolactobacillus laevolacticus]|nr:TetR family transcriptional regulator [Sporolactobacillus laevolacticus]